MLTLAAVGCSNHGQAICHAVPLSSACAAVAIVAPRVTLRLAIADTAERRERGLMGLRSFPPDEGMIFVFPDATNAMRAFWMKDTLVPLDMVFVRSDGIVTELAENVAATKPGTPDSRIAKREAVARFVIELRSGEAEASGLLPGTRLTIPPLAGQ